MYNCAKFHNCRICVTDFREGGSLDHPSLSSPETSHPEKLKNNYFLPLLSSEKSLEIMWKFDLFKNSKMCILYKQSFQWWNFFWQIWATVNCKGQQNCSHTMECNSNDKQDSSKRSNEFLKLYLHKAVMRVLEGPLFFNAKKDLLRALPVDPSCYASQLVTSSAMPKVQVLDESKVHIQSRIFPWKPIFPKHLNELFTISN